MWDMPACSFHKHSKPLLVSYILSVRTDEVAYDLENGFRRMSEITHRAPEN